MLSLLLKEKVDAMGDCNLGTSPVEEPAGVLRLYGVLADGITSRLTF